MYNYCFFSKRGNEDDKDNDMFIVIPSLQANIWGSRHEKTTTFRTAVRARIEFARKFNSIFSKDFEISACNDVNISICIRIHVSIYIYKRIQTYINICIYKCFVCRFDCGIQLEDFICPCLSIEVKSICLLFRFCVTPSASLCPGSSLRFFRFAPYSTHPFFSVKG